MKRTVLLALLIVSPLQAQGTKDYSSLLWATSVIGISGFFYTLLSNYSVHNKLSAHKKKFRHQEFIADRYETAFRVLTNYNNYIALVKDTPHPAQAVSNMLLTQFAQDAHLLPTFLAQATTRRQMLEFKKRELDHAFSEWDNNRKKVLLNLQKPHILATFDLTITTLQTIEEQVPYVEAVLFLTEVETTLKKEFLLADNDGPLGPHIITHSAVEQAYPYRAFVSKLEQYYTKAAALKAALDGLQIAQFQQATVKQLTRCVNQLDGLVKKGKTSEEYAADCLKYETAQEASEKEQENLALKKQIAELKKQVQTLETEPT